MFMIEKEKNEVKYGSEVEGGDVLYNVKVNCERLKDISVGVNQFEIDCLYIAIKLPVLDKTWTHVYIWHSASTTASRHRETSSGPKPTLEMIRFSKHFRTLPP